MNRNANFHVGSSPVEGIQRAAQQYSRQNGIYVPQHEDYSHTAMAWPQSRKIADAYDAMPEFDKRALPAYKQMAEETGRQFDFMTKPRSKGGMGIDVQVTHDDPYAQDGDFNKVVDRFRNDVVNNNRMQVLSTQATGGHPVFSNDQNDMFRAVHDVFGHLGSGRGIDSHGEEAAFQKHSRMFSPLARQAMATETRGQNAALHKHGEFQEQKVGFLPHVMQQAQFSQGNWADQLAAVRDARMENQKQGL